MMAVRTMPWRRRRIESAADIRIPPDHARRLATLTSNADVIQFADHIGIAPGIVVGWLHQKIVGVE